MDLGGEGVYLGAFQEGEDVIGGGSRELRGEGFCLDLLRLLVSRRGAGLAGGREEALFLGSGGLDLHLLFEGEFENLLTVFQHRLLYVALFDLLEGNGGVDGLVVDGVVGSEERQADKQQHDKGNDADVAE